MKMSLIALSMALAAPAALAFSTHTTARTSSSVTSLQAATMDETTATTPTREAPGAGWEPDWEDRPGLSPEEFMKSDMSKPDLSGMWECPLTKWDSDNVDIVKAQKEAAKMPHCPLEMRASAGDNAMGAEYFAKNKQQIKADLLKYGAIWFRGFDLMKSVQGHRAMYEALELEPCLDPLHSSGLRKFASERDALYEEVSYREQQQVWEMQTRRLDRFCLTISFFFEQTL